jgi:hypothetical protein
MDTHVNTLGNTASLEDQSVRSELNAGEPRSQATRKKASSGRLTRGLAWFSIGLGLAECLAPKRIADIAGLDRRNAGTIRLFGFREIASGMAILGSNERATPGLWSRVAGDALDLACLGKAFASPKSNKSRLGFATANVLAVTALDLVCANKSNKKDKNAERIPSSFPVI